MWEASKGKHIINFKQNSCSKQNHRIDKDGFMCFCGWLQNVDLPYKVKYLNILLRRHTGTKLDNKQHHTDNYHHCVKSVQIWSYFWSVFSCIRTEYGDLLMAISGINLHIQSEYTPYLDTIQEVHEMGTNQLLAELSVRFSVVSINREAIWEVEKE